MAKKSLTHEEFEDTVSSMNLAEQTKTIAYNVLVLGHKQAIYVKEFQISKGAINQSVLRVYNEFLNRQGFYASSKRKANLNWTWYDDAEEKIIAFTKRELANAHRNMKAEEDARLEAKIVERLEQITESQRQLLFKK